MTDSTIDDLFNILDERRHLPKYKLELRASPFFELFLLEVLNAHYKPLAFNPIVIPEFPLKKDNNYQSTNVDFFAVSDDYERAFLIELKTDMGYLVPAQAQRLQHAASRDISVLLSDLNSIANASQAKRKYSRLQKTLENLKVSQLKADLKPEIIYILPSFPNLTRRPYLSRTEIITFEQFASIVKGSGKIGERFAKSLEEWACVPAGSP